MRAEHPLAKKKLTLEEYLRVEHIQVAPRGRPGGSLDDVLRELGVTRRVARAVPYFMVGLLLVSETDYIITISEKLAQRLAPTLGLVLREPPLSLKPYTLTLLWHPRMDGDPGHRWLREALGKGELAK
jgi:DNA-binding transcriptional LysR family regulator